MLAHCRSLLLYMVLAVILGACASNGSQTPVIERSEVGGSRNYKIKQGDTLYSVAWRYGTSVERIAGANRIPKPYTIYVGQKLYIPAKGEKVAKPPRSSARTRSDKPPPQATSTASSNTQASVPVVSTPATPVSAPAEPLPNSNKEPWRHPTLGKVSRHYSAAKPAHKGVDYGGKLGQAIKAAKSGRVVYAGDGLKAYGLLVIIKHDQHFLSAYAYNNKVFVKEGDVVKSGQKIAEMGNKENRVTLLHFEIRKNGKPVNPVLYLK